jgi:hypothetical protein
MIFSTPFLPSTTGTPTNSPCTPYSPSSRAQVAMIFFLSKTIASTISSAASAGDTNADPTPSMPITSPPALRVRVSISVSVFSSTNLVAGMPAMRQQLLIGTMSSPCPPSTIATTFSTETPAACATK